MAIFSTVNLSCANPTHKTGTASLLVFAPVQHTWDNNLGPPCHHSPAGFASLYVPQRLHSRRLSGVIRRDLLRAFEKMLWSSAPLFEPLHHYVPWWPSWWRTDDPALVALHLSSGECESERCNGRFRGPIPFQCSCWDDSVCNQAITLRTPVVRVMAYGLPLHVVKRSLVQSAPARYPGFGRVLRTGPCGFG